MQPLRDESGGVMKAIDFVARDGAGGVARSVVAAGESAVVPLDDGQEMSFNLLQVDLIGQQRRATIWSSH